MHPTPLTLLFTLSADPDQNVFSLSAIKVLEGTQVCYDAAADIPQDLREFLAKVEATQQMPCYRDSRNQLVLNHFSPDSKQIFAGVIACTPKRPEETSIVAGLEQMIEPGILNIPFSALATTDPAAAIAAIIMEELDLKKTPTSHSANKKLKKPEGKKRNLVYLHLWCKKSTKGLPKYLMHGEFNREKDIGADYRLIVDDRASEHFERLEGDCYELDVDFINAVRKSVGSQSCFRLFQPAVSENEFLRSVVRQAYAQLLRREPKKIRPKI